MKIPKQNRKAELDEYEEEVNDAYLWLQDDKRTNLDMMKTDKKNKHLKFSASKVRNVQLKSFDHKLTNQQNDATKGFDANERVGVEGYSKNRNRVIEKQLQELANSKTQVKTNGKKLRNVRNASMRGQCAEQKNNLQNNALRVEPGSKNHVLQNHVSLATQKPSESPKKKVMQQHLKIEESNTETQNSKYREFLAEKETEIEQNKDVPTRKRPSGDTRQNRRRMEHPIGYERRENDDEAHDGVNLGSNSGRRTTTSSSRRAESADNRQQQFAESGRVVKRQQVQSQNQQVVRQVPTNQETQLRRQRAAKAGNHQKRSRDHEISQKRTMECAEASNQNTSSRERHAHRQRRTRHANEGTGLAQKSRRERDDVS